MRFSRGARVVLLGAFPETFGQDVLIMETRLALGEARQSFAKAGRRGGGGGSGITVALAAPFLGPAPDPFRASCSSCSASTKPRRAGDALSIRQRRWLQYRIWLATLRRQRHRLSLGATTHPATPSRRAGGRNQEVGRKGGEYQLRHFIFCFLHFSTLPAISNLIS